MARTSDFSEPFNLLAVSPLNFFDIGIGEQISMALRIDFSTGWVAPIYWHFE